MPRRLRRGDEGKKLTDAEALPFHLALRLGFPHPDYLLPRLTARQLADWQRYAAQYGIGPERGDIYHAMLLSMFHNVHRVDGADAKPASDFLVWDRPDPFEAELSEEDFVARIRSIVPCQPSQI